jgi:hypothetical protein
MEYTVESARRLAEELRAIPPKDPTQRRLDKQGMVRELAAEIVALQERGYTIEEVAESLRGRGFEITTPTLKNYLQRAKSTGARAGKARRPAARLQPRSLPRASRDKAPPQQRAGAEPSSNGPASSAKSASPATPAVEPVLRSGKSAFLIKDKESY